MGKSNRKQNKRNKMVIIVALLVLLTFVLLIAQIVQLVKSASSIKNKNDSSNVVSEEKQEEKGKEELKFDTFVDEIYTEEELESLSVEDINRLLKLESAKFEQVDCKRVVGSANNINDAKKIAGDAFLGQNQFLIKTDLVAEDETFYIINVSWRYVSENVNSVYNQKVMVFKKFYFDIENQILNLDEIDKIKLVLDLNNYVRNQNNSNKKLIQSFMHKEGKRCEYILYYIDANYGTNGQRDSVNLVKETVVINPETGAIEQDVEKVVRENVVME